MRAMRSILALALALVPFLARAQAAKDPLSYPLKQWLLMLGLAIFGGLASWVNKVRTGTVAIHNLPALVGELTIAAFAGLMTFFLCEYMAFAPILTATMVGMSGHMGGRAVTILEGVLERKLGVPRDDAGPGR